MINSSDAALVTRASEAERVRNPVFDMAPFALPSAFWSPSYTRGTIWLEHLPFCFWAVEASRPGTVVTVGGSNGLPHFALCEAVLRLGLQARCLAFLQGTSLAPDLMSHGEEHFGAFSRIEATDGGDVVSLAPSGIDLLVLADHGDGGAVDIQWEAWLPKLSARAVILLPRIDSGAPGGASAWERLRSEYPHFHFHHGGGLGVAGVGDELPELFHHLVSLRDGRHAGLVRAMFARLGAAVAETHRHAAAKRGAQKSDSRIQALETDLRVLRARHDAARHKLDKTEDRLAKAEAELEVSERKLGAVGSELEKARGRVTALESDLATRTRDLDLRLEHAARVAAAVEELKRSHEADKARLVETRRALAEAETGKNRIAAQLHAERKRADQRVRGVKGEAAGFRKKLKRERELHQQARNELSAILASRSWALTSPLRWINGVGRRLLGG